MEEGQGSGEHGLGECQRVRAAGDVPTRGFTSGWEGRHRRGRGRMGLSRGEGPKAEATSLRTGR